MKLKKRATKKSDAVVVYMQPMPRAASNIDLDTFSDNISDEVYVSLLGGDRKVVSKPDISKLPDATTAGIPNFEPGDKIVIERYASFLKGNPYLDTRTYTVMTLDTFSGRLGLYDESVSQFASANFIRDIRSGNVFKLADGHTVSTKKKRGRPRKGPLLTVVELAAAAALAAATPKRGRGRPAGVKNRPKDVIAAERDIVKAGRIAKAKAKAKARRK